MRVKSTARFLTVFMAFAVVFAGAALVVPPSYGQTKPTPLKKVLAMRVSPGSVALLALHANDAQAQQRIAAAVGDVAPRVRAVAARVAFTRGITMLLPGIAEQLAVETDGYAAYEQTRALSLAGTKYASEIAAAVQRLGDLNPLLSEPTERIRARFAKLSPTQLFRIPADYPPGLLDSVAEATKCKLEDAARARAAAGAEVTLRLDGRVSAISVMDAKLKKECAEAVLALFALYAAGLPAPGEDGERRLIMIPLLPEEPACRLDPKLAPTLPEPIGSGAFRAPQKVYDVKPVYPASAQRERKSGIVILEAVISTTGCVSGATVLRSVDPSLDWAALYAVLQWRFTPTSVNGRPTAVIMSVTMTFTLNN